MCYPPPTPQGPLVVIKLLMRHEEATALACVGFWLSGFRARLEETPVTRCDAPVVTEWPIPALDELLARVKRTATAVNRSAPVAHSTVHRQPGDTTLGAPVAVQAAQQVAAASGNLTPDRATDDSDG